jgi:Xaa-Pro aminopeptidase
MNYRSRVQALQVKLAERGLDVLLIGQPHNRHYLTGFDWSDESAAASSGWIVLTPQTGYLLTSFLYFSAVEKVMRHLEPVQVPIGTRVSDGLTALLGRTTGRRIGFEGNWVSYCYYHTLAEGLPGRELVSADGFVEDLREFKDVDELAILRRAIKVTDRAYADVLGELRPGQTEREIAWRLERGLRDLGADSMAFGPTVAAGANAAVPHHESGDHAVQAGESIWIDLGARIDGYCGDLTRSFCLGWASPEYLETWHLVLRAQEAALRGIRTGVTGKAADALARDVFAAAGRGSEFGHALGHGIGLVIHESPRLGPTIDEPLRTGMVVTVEPGLYRSDWGGIRHEDVVVIEPTGAPILSAAPKAPVR